MGILQDEQLSSLNDGVRSQLSGERILRFLSTCKVYSQLLLTVVELSSEDTTMVFSVKSTFSTGLAMPQLHTSRFAVSYHLSE